MKTKLLTFLATLLPLPAAACLYLGILPTTSMAMLVVLTIYLFVRILRALDPSDQPAKPTPMSKVEFDPEAWPPQPVDDVDHRRKDSRRMSTVLRNLRLQSVRIT